MGMTPPLSRRRPQRSNAPMSRSTGYSAEIDWTSELMGSLPAGALFDQVDEIADRGGVLHVDIFQRNVEAIFQFENDVDHAGGIDAQLVGKPGGAVDGALALFLRGEAGDDFLNVGDKRCGFVGHKSSLI